MATSRDFHKTLYLNDIKATVKMRKVDYDLSIRLLFTVKREVTHKRLDAISQGITDHESLKYITTLLKKFISDLDVYYSMPAI